MKSHHYRAALAAAVLPFLISAHAAQAQPQTAPEPASTQTAADVQTAARGLEEVIVTARRREERAQDVPIAISAFAGTVLERQGTFTVQQVAAQAPSLQFNSSNPRNTSLNIRGLGVSFGLANDGLEQGVGFYVDQVFNSRPAAATFDLLDIERVEVLRGPQGTLFGKNTTAGAINITTRAPSFTPEGTIEGSVGDYGFFQGKAGISGPLTSNLAGRLSIGRTVRDGLIRNVLSNRRVNDLDNLSIRGQLLYTPSDALRVRLIADIGRQDPDCCTQVFVRVGQTLRPAAQQYPALAAALNYAPPSLDPYDRLADVDAPIRAKQELGGVTLIGDYETGFGTFTSVSAWRWWDWQPANDRDYTKLDILRQSANPVQQDQYSQELRLASPGGERIDYTIGAYAFYQKLNGQNVTEWGRDASLWLLGAAVPRNLIDGYITTSDAVSTIESYAGFAQATWNVTDAFKITPGLRYTYEKKKADYESVVSGGLATTDPTLIARKLSIFRPQAYQANFTDSALSGQLNISYDLADDALVYASYARGFKSGGINLAGLPFNANNNPALNRAVIDPERAQTYEIGVKTAWFERRLTANFALFRNDVKNFQANVVDTGPGALRGYLANIEKVRTQGVEADLVLAPIGGFSAYARLAYTDGEYVSFANAPCPLERIAATTASCDLSGAELPGTSKWAASLGGEYRRDTRYDGAAYIAADVSYRSAYFADASDSIYARIKGYAVVNARIGFESENGWEVFVFARNLLDKNYLQFVTVQSGNSGFLSGLPGDQRTYGVTARYKFGG
jgi:iron complex outermembrane receptor protein